MSEPQPQHTHLTPAQRAQWVTSNPEGYFEHVREEAQNAAEAAVAARLASEKFHRKDNRWYRRLWRHLKR